MRLRSQSCVGVLPATTLSNPQPVSQRAAAPSVLPQELLALIFGHADDRSLVAGSLTCKAWRLAAWNSLGNRQLLQRTLPGVVLPASDAKLAGAVLRQARISTNIAEGRFTSRTVGPPPVEVAWQQFHPGCATFSMEYHIDVWDLRKSPKFLTFVPKWPRWDNTFTRSAVSDDNHYMLTAQEQGNAFLWNLKTRSHQELDHDWIGAVAMSADGSMAVSASNVDARSLKLWDIQQTPAVATDLVSPDHIFHLAVSQDTRRLAAGGDKGDIFLWNLRDTAQAFDRLPGDSRIDALKFSSNGEYLASLVCGFKIKLWDLRCTPAVEVALPAGNPQRSPTFSFDNRFFAYTSGSHIVLCDLTTVPLATTLLDHTQYPYSVHFAPQAHRLVSAADNTIKIWDLQARDKISTFVFKTFTAHERGEYLPHVLFSADGSKVTAVGGTSDALVMHDFAPALGAAKSVRGIIE